MLSSRASHRAKARNGALRSEGVERQGDGQYSECPVTALLAEQRPALARSRARPAASTRELCRDRPRPQQWPESCGRSANRGGSKAQPSRSQKTKPASELVCCRFE